MKKLDYIYIALIFAISSFCTCLIMFNSIDLLLAHEIIIISLIIFIAFSEIKNKKKENKKSRQELNNIIENRLKEISVNKLFKNKLKNI